MTLCCVTVSMAVTVFSLPAGHLVENRYYILVSGIIPFFLAGAMSLFVLHQVKITQSLADQLAQALNTDHLTGAASRGHFFRQLAEMRGAGGHIVLADADRFKSVNDTYGHAAGDAVLRHLVQTVMDVVGDRGIVGRMGGEEFAIRLPGASLAETRLLLAAIGTALRLKGIVVDGTPLHPTLSMGVVAEDGASAIDALLAVADACLYQAKAEGRDRVVFDPGTAQGLSQARGAGHLRGQR